MDFISGIHGLHLPPGFGTPFFPTPLALITLILFCWSILPAIQQKISGPFLIYLRLTWLAALYPAITGLLLALNGRKVPSATAVNGDLSKYNLPADPSRNWEHWMYAGFILLTLYIIELLIKGEWIKREVALRYLPLATFFLYGVAIRVGQVAVFPGSTPGT